MKTHLIIVQLLLLTHLVGCESPIKTMTTMKDTTTEMKNSTKEMGKDVNNTNVNSAHLEMLMIQGQTSDFRDKQFEMMVKDESFTGKADYAAKLMYTMEFEVWSDTGLKNDNMLAQLENSRQEAVIELAKKIDGFYKNDFLDGLKGTESDSDAMNFFAIAAVLHRINPKQIVLRKTANIPESFAIDSRVQEMTRINLDVALDTFTQIRYDFPTETMLDLIVQGLLKADAINNGSITKNDLKPFEKEVLKEELKFKRLIEARYKFFPVIALTKLSKIDDGSAISKKATQIKMLFANWKPNHLEVKDSKNTNNIEINYVNEILAHAIKAKEILLELGEHPSIDANIAKIYSHMDLSTAKKDVSLNQGKADNRNQLFIKLETQIDNILK